MRGLPADENPIQALISNGGVVWATYYDANSHTQFRLLHPPTTYYWHVKAENSCGLSPFSSTYSFKTTAASPILLVDDDDNHPDVRSIYTETLEGLGLAYDIWDTAHSDIEPNESDLGFHEIVIWFTGLQGQGPDAAGESALGAWLGSRKCLFINSQEYRFYGGITPFMINYLGVLSSAEDARHTQVTGQGSIFGGLGLYELVNLFLLWANFSDRINPNSTAEVAFLGDQGNADLNKDSGHYRTTYWGFPFETIGSASDRAELMDFVVDWCSSLPEYLYLPLLVK